MYPQITLNDYEKSRGNIDEKIKSTKPFVYFEHDPEVYGKTHALMLVAEHTERDVPEVYEFINAPKNRKQIRTHLTRKRECPQHWKDDEIVSYANIIIGVMNDFIGCSVL